MGEIISYFICFIKKREIDYAFFGFKSVFFPSMNFVGVAFFFSSFSMFSMYSGDAVCDVCDVSLGFC